MGLLLNAVNRKNLLVVCCLAWSLASVISGTTSSFLVLCAMRFITGACVSATEPASLSILGDYFPKNKRSTANSLLTTGSYIGTGYASLSVLAVAKYGWRASYVYLGLISAISAILTFFSVKEPERGIQAKLEQQDNSMSSTTITTIETPVQKPSILSLFFSSLKNVMK